MSTRFAKSSRCYRRHGSLAQAAFKVAKPLDLFQVTGVTDQKSLANFAFGLIDGEKEHHFQWLCDCLNELREDIGANLPAVVITDKEEALRTALRKAFPHAQQQLCVYHIVANVRATINARWKDPSDCDDDNLPTDSEIDESTDPPNYNGYCMPQFDSELDLDVAARGRTQTEAEHGITNERRPNEYTRDAMFKAFQAVVYAPDHDSFRDS